MEFEKVILVVTGNFPEKFVTLITEVTEDFRLLAAETEIEELIALGVVPSLLEAASLASQSKLGDGVLRVKLVNLVSF
jgi:hypothetical protein